MNNQRDTKPCFRPAKRAIFVVAIVVAVVALVIAAGRGINYLKHFSLIQNGVDQEEYVNLNGQEQFILTRGMSTDNPIIIYVHGGPASPDTTLTYAFSDYLVDDYTVIAWDQRGCGRTYFANENTDPHNETASFEQALDDLDALVDYAREKYGQQKVVILGHSCGTILGSVYVQNHPEKVSAYIGAAQITCLPQTDIYGYETALGKAQAAGEDTTNLEKVYLTYDADKSVVNVLALRNMLSAYYHSDVQDLSAFYAIFSPYSNLEDLCWLWKQESDFASFVTLNQQLFDYARAFDIATLPTNYDVPVYYISGSCDWICPVDSIAQYFETISAPDKRFEIIEGPGHSVQYSAPREFAEVIKNLLAN